MTTPPLSDVYGLLEAEDYLIAKNQDGPALHSVPGDDLVWESYNRWLCFPADSVKVDCRDEKSDLSWDAVDPEERDGNGYLQVMEAEHEGQVYRFESPGSISPDRCQNELARTRELMNGQAGVCVFASHWQSENEVLSGAQDELSIWTVYGLKTRAGRVMAPIFDSDFVDEQPDEEAGN